MSEPLIYKVHSVAYHRNGIAGAPFHVVTFTSTLNEEMVRTEMVATVFEAPGAVAVLAMGMLAEGNIAFGENSWRGDRYEPELRAAIAAENPGCLRSLGGGA